jgi:AcrR family transcriptional regulator
MPRRAATPRDTKEELLDAAEQLFARDGIHGARIREINALAGQRNPSALHYHFGSRRGLVEAIMLRHQSDIDKVVERRLDELEAAGELDVHQIIAAVIEPTLARLRTPSGRAWARILPQILGTLSVNLRRGVAEPATPQSHRILDLLKEKVAHLPEKVQRERLVAYVLVLSTLVADRAHQLESGRRPSLNEAQFAEHLVGVLVAVVTGGEPRA